MKNKMLNSKSFWIGAIVGLVLFIVGFIPDLLFSLAEKGADQVYEEIPFHLINLVKHLFIPGFLFFLYAGTNKKWNTILRSCVYGIVGIVLIGYVQYQYFLTYGQAGAYFPRILLTAIVYPPPLLFTSWVPVFWFPNNLILNGMLGALVGIIVEKKIKKNRNKI